MGLILIIGATRTVGREVISQLIGSACKCAHAIRSQDGLRFGHRGDLFERPLPIPLGNFRQSRSLRVTQGNSRCKV
jgi:hypothetical protein